MRRFRLRLFIAACFMLTLVPLFAGELPEPVAAKLDPRLRLLLQQPELQKGLLAQAGGLHATTAGEFATVLVKTRGTRSELAARGARVLAMIGEIAVLEAPVAQLEAIAGLPNVVYLEAARLLRFSNDTGVVEAGGKAAAQQFNLTGKGVIVGVIDSGIDWRHGDFRKAGGQTRIKYLLDLSQGGMVYTEAEINAALSGGVALTTTDRNGHGSHVTGSAAGNGLATGANIPAGTFAGMAPEADIIFVKSKNGDSGNISDADAVRGLSFIDSVAGRLGKPYVVNLSFGGHSGAHDGSSLQEQAIDELVGAGKPGKVIVVAAGNDGDNDIHAGGAVSNSVTVNFNVPAFAASSGTQNDYLEMNAWYPGNATLSFRLTAPNNAQYTANSGVRFAQDTPNGAVIIDNASTGANPLNNDKEVLIQVFDFSSNLPAVGTWKLTITGNVSRYDLWLVGSSMGAALTSNLDTTRTVTIPATAKNVITVGAWNTKRTWVDLDNNSLQSPGVVLGAAGSFSGSGPTRDGRTKPEISAPGQMIASTLSAEASPNSPFSIWKGTASFPNAFTLRDNRHAVGRGTSFAAPLVAGGIALLLEKNPNRDALHIRNALTASARRDAFTGPVPNQKWGYGKVDFLAALTPTAVADFATAGRPPAAFALLPNYPNPFNPATTIAFQLPAASAVELAVYDISGRRVQHLLAGKLPAGLHRVRWNGRDEGGNAVSTGVYFCKIIAGNWVASQKLLLLQ
ncbi:S8 family serine peptidase [candidate division KSB1 bacterium]|nr:S8 family serine peptidase [bacterium]NUM63855.1 S8 family serine peptidase [candidate division KSB1 bacterium]